MNTDPDALPSNESTPVPDIPLEQAVPVPTRDTEVTTDIPKVDTDRPSHHHTFDKEYDHPLDDTRKDDNSVKLPADFTKATFNAYRFIRNISVDVNSPAVAKWMDTVEEGWKLNTAKEALEPRLNQGSWSTYMKTDQGEVGINQGQMSSAKGQLLTDLTAAKWRVLHHIGSGGVIQIYMYHSGFWVTIVPPTDEELLELYRLINKDRVILGRHTYGAVYSNNSVITTKRFTEFIIDHIDDATVRIDRDSDVTLADLIVPQDVPLLELGMLASLWPDGVKYERGCSKSPKTCHHVTESLLDLTELFHFDNSVIQPPQSVHITNRKKNSYTSTNTNRYQEALVKKEVVRVVKFGLGKEITIHLKTPSLADHIQSGERWLEDINVAIEDSLGEDPTDEKRNLFIQENAVATVLRQYSHWITYIDMGNDGYATRVPEKDAEGNEIDSVAIHTLLGWLSSNKPVAEQIMKHVADYINDHTLALVGIRNHICPTCDQPQNPTGDDKVLSTHVLPLDTTRLFFKMLALRVGAILDRRSM